MFYYKDGDVLISTNTKRDLLEAAAEEVAAAYEEFERDAASSVCYDDLVNAEIRKRYSESQEFAVLRQKNTKPEEYEEYFNYCEDCKQKVRAGLGA